MTESQSEAMLIVFFVIRGLIMIGCISKGQIVKQKYTWRLWQRTSEEEKVRNVEQ
jgi:hypothetical protein